MSFQPRYVCDVCSKPKGDANHWFVSMPMFEKTERAPGAATVMFFTVMHWQDRFAQEPGAKHLCSEECAHKMLGRFLTPPEAVQPIDHGILVGKPARPWEKQPSPICPYCGPECFGGAEHNARVEDNALYEAKSLLADPLQDREVVRGG